MQQVSSSPQLTSVLTYADKIAVPDNIPTIDWVESAETISETKYLNWGACLMVTKLLVSGTPGLVC